MDTWQTYQSVLRACDGCYEGDREEGKAVDTMKLRVLAVGQWLGTDNKIVKMQEYKYGWKAWDSTGVTYRQPEFPYGLRTADRPQSCIGEFRTEWPDDE